MIVVVVINETVLTEMGLIIYFNIHLWLFGTALLLAGTAEQRRLRLGLPSGGQGGFQGGHSGGTEQGFCGMGSPGSSRIMLVLFLAGLTLVEGVEVCKVADLSLVTQTGEFFLAGERAPAHNPPVGVPWHDVSTAKT